MRLITILIASMLTCTCFGQVRVQTAGSTNYTTIVKMDTTMVRDTLPARSGVFALIADVNIKTAAANPNATSPDATDLPSAITLINELKAVVNALQAKLRAATLIISP